MLSVARVSIQTCRPSLSSSRESRHQSGCFLPSTRTLNNSPSGAPRHPHVGKRALAVLGAGVELRQIQQPIRFVELDAARFPDRLVPRDRHGEAEQEPRGNQCVGA